MKGIQFRLEKAATQIQTILIKPTVKLTTDIFQLSFSKFCLQALQMAEMIITHYSPQKHMPAMFNKMVTKLKQSRKFRPQAQQQEQIISGNDQVYKFLSQRKPIHEANNLGEFNWFVQRMEKKQKDTSAFLQNINHIKKPIDIQKKIKRQNHQTQTDLTWIQKFKLVEESKQKVQILMSEIPQYVQEMKQKAQKLKQMQNKISQTNKKYDEMIKQKQKQKQKQEIEIQADIQPINQNKVSQKNLQNQPKLNKKKKSGNTNSKKNTKQKKQRNSKILNINKDGPQVKKIGESRFNSIMLNQKNQKSQFIGLQQIVSNKNISKSNKIIEHDFICQQSQMKKQQQVQKLQKGQHIGDAISQNGIKQNQSLFHKSNQRIENMKNIQQKKRINKYSQSQKSILAKEEAQANQQNYTNNQNKKENEFDEQQKINECGNSKNKKSQDQIIKKEQIITKQQKQQKEQQQKQNQLIRLKQLPQNIKKYNKNYNIFNRFSQGEKTNAHKRRNAQQIIDQTQTLTQRDFNTLQNLRSLSIQDQNSSQKNNILINFYENKRKINKNLQQSNINVDKNNTVHKQTEIKIRKLSKNSSSQKQNRELNKKNNLSYYQQKIKIANTTSKFNSKVKQFFNKKFQQNLPCIYKDKKMVCYKSQTNQLQIGESSNSDSLNLKFNGECQLANQKFQQLPLVKKDSLILHKINQIQKNNKNNRSQLGFYMAILQKIHINHCGEKCKHLQRYYKQLKNGYNWHNRVAIHLPTRKIGFFS